MPFDPCKLDDEVSILIRDLLWSDPITDSDAELRGLELREGTVNGEKYSYYYNTTRNTGQFVKESVIMRFVDENGLDLIIRGHEAP